MRSKTANTGRAEQTGEEVQAWCRKSLVELHSWGLRGAHPARPLRVNRLPLKWGSWSLYHFPHFFRR